MALGLCMFLFISTIKDTVAPSEACHGHINWNLMQIHQKLLSGLSQSSTSIRGGKWPVPDSGSVPSAKKHQVDIQFNSHHNSRKSSGYRLSISADSQKKGGRGGV